MRRLLWRWRPPSVGVETDVALGESVRSISIVGSFCELWFVFFKRCYKREGRICIQSSNKDEKENKGSGRRKEGCELKRGRVKKKERKRKKEKEEQRTKEECAW